MLISTNSYWFSVSIMYSNFEYLSAKVLGRLVPVLYQKRLLSWAKRAGLEEPTLLLSFDCDTGRDADASLRVQRFLSEYGIAASFAVPGALLEEHWDSYKVLLDMGATFVNHGYKRHAEIDETSGKPYSTFTYRDVTDKEWAEDIKLGHAALTRLTGVAPKVFRTPHFGEFNQPAQLCGLYKVLADLGYEVSSSTIPVFGLMYGSAFRTEKGIVELPLNGCIGKPAQLIDSWGFLSAPDALGKDRLVAELSKYLALAGRGEPFVLSLYFDPADIADEPDILDLLARFAGIRSLRLDDEKLISLARN